jgi:hypothetical protein
VAPNQSNPGMEAHMLIGLRCMRHRSANDQLTLRRDPLSSVAFPPSSPTSLIPKPWQVIQPGTCAGNTSRRSVSSPRRSPSGLENRTPVPPASSPRSVPSEALLGLLLQHTLQPVSRDKRGRPSSLIGLFASECCSIQATPLASALGKPVFELFPETL